MYPSMHSAPIKADIEKQAEDVAKRFRDLPCVEIPATRFSIKGIERAIVEELQPWTDEKRQCAKERLLKDGQRDEIWASFDRNHELHVVRGALELVVAVQYLKLPHVKAVIFNDSRSDLSLSMLDFYRYCQTKDFVPWRYIYNRFRWHCNNGLRGSKKDLIDSIWHLYLVCGAKKPGRQEELFSMGQTKEGRDALNQEYNELRYCYDLEQSDSEVGLWAVNSMSNEDTDGRPNRLKGKDIKALWEKLQK